MRVASTSSLLRRATSVTPESRDDLLRAGADERCLCPEEWDRLALHVRAHEGALASSFSGTG
jgi:hypothetical protein